MFDEAKPPALFADPARELARLRQALRAAGDTVYEWDVKADRMEWSANAGDILGLDAAKAISRGHFLERVNPVDLPILHQPPVRLVGAGGRIAQDFRFRRPDGAYAWVQERAQVVAWDGKQPARIIGSVRFAAAAGTDGARRDGADQFDTLTGHFNRTRLREALAHAVAYAARYQTPGAYLVISIDNLDRLVDAYGHSAADDAVMALGQALDRSLRACDVIGRVGEDRFGVVLNGCPEAEVPTAADKLLQAAQRLTLTAADRPLVLTLAIGGVSFPATARTAEDAMTKADIAVDRARRAGFNCFFSYNLTEAEESDRRHHMLIARQVQEAVIENRLLLHFQPVVRSDTRAVAFHECLVRMVTAEGELVPAARFLPVAEQMGLVRLIDRRVLDLAIDELVQTLDLSLSINVSGLTTTDPAWLRAIAARLKDRPDVARRLMIEITETATLHDMAESQRFVATLRDIGCQVALDDFGAGYTSFRHLKALAVDTVKIDGSFVRNLARSSDDRLFIRTLLNLSQAFGLNTVAECVEGEEVAAMLAKKGVTYLQGYLFGRPTGERPWAVPAVADAACG